jgi:hypothetical protein
VTVCPEDLLGVCTDRLQAFHRVLHGSMQKNAGGGGPRLTGTSGGPTGVAATPKVDGQARKPDTPKTGHQVVRSFLVCRLIPIGTAAVRLHGPRLVCVCTFVVGSIQRGFWKYRA